MTIICHRGNRTAPLATAPTDPRRFLLPVPATLRITNGPFEGLRVLRSQAFLPDIYRQQIELVCIIYPVEIYHGLPVTLFPQDLAFHGANSPPNYA